MTHRFFIGPTPDLVSGAQLSLPPGAAKHVQVLRCQPGDALTLFTGSGGEWSARIVAMGRSHVDVVLGEHIAVSRELPLQVTIALGMPANERMDSLVEKACELGVAQIQPLLCERSVLRLTGERAERRVAHWQAIATAASEQCGRTSVALIAPVLTLPNWLAQLEKAAAGQARWLLSPGASTSFSQELAKRGSSSQALFISGPEGGLSLNEEEAALAASFVKCTLGPRILRADTAPLAVLSQVAGYLGG